jgi:hypothetical protein
MLSIRYNDWEDCTCQNAQTFLCAAPSIFLDNLEVPTFSDEDEEDIELWPCLVSQFKWLDYFLMPRGTGMLQLMKENTLLCSLVDACLCRADQLKNIYNKYESNHLVIE